MSETFNGILLPSGWLVYYTDDGRPYFHSRLTAATQWDPPLSTTPSTKGMVSTTTSSTIGAVLRDDNNDDDKDDGTLNGYGTTDGEITAPRPLQSNGGRMIHLSDDVSRGGIGKKFPSGGPLESAKKKKGGYTSLLQSGGLDGQIESKSGTKIAGQIPHTSTSQAAVTSGAWCYFLEISYLQSFFDVDTQSVLDRILTSILPYRVLHEITLASASSSSASNGIKTSIRTSPDLYGPFWIPTSLIFIMFITSNVTSLFSGHMGRTNFLTLVIAFFMFYGYGLIVPLAIWVVTLFLGGTHERESITARQLLSVYGYSLAVALPISLLSLIPSMAFRWLLAVIGTGVSLLFVFFHFKGDFIQSEPVFKLSVLGLLVIAQISFYAAFPLYFFKI